MDLAYFTAPDDDTAAEAESRLGGPLGWPAVTAYRRAGLFRKEPVVETLGPAFDGFQTRGYDPVVVLGTLETLVRHIEYEELEKNPRWGRAPSDAEPPDGAGVVTLTDTLRDALAAASDDDVHLVAEPWSRTEELSDAGWEGTTLTDHVGFLMQLRDLARSAQQRSHHLYCYFES